MNGTRTLSAEIEEQIQKQQQQQQQKQMEQQQQQQNPSNSETVIPPIEVTPLAFQDMEFAYDFGQCMFR